MGVRGLRFEDLPGWVGDDHEAGRAMARDGVFSLDPEVTPLGLPVWVETDILTGPLADIFFGSDYAAGQMASSQKAHGRLITLIPCALPLVLSRE